MEHKTKAELLSVLGIISYIAFSLVYMFDTAYNWDIVRNFNVLDIRFLVVFMLVLFWFLPICVLVNRYSKMTDMKKLHSYQNCWLSIIFYL